MKGGVTAGVATVGAGVLGTSLSAFAEEGPEERSGRLTRGDAALLRFAAAAEILETDFWDQYNDIEGVQDNEFPGGGGAETQGPRCLLGHKLPPDVNPRFFWTPYIYESTALLQDVKIWSLRL